MTTLTYIFGAVILLGLCIFVHELGHLLGGRMVGIKAKVFSMGYGKGFWRKKYGDTTYQITLIPFGGYCQFYGEDPSEERSGEGFEFLSAHPLKRIVTVAMGPIFNLIFGIILFYIMNLTGYTKETNRILIPVEYTYGSYISPAYQSGLRTGDRIVAISGAEVKAFSDIQSEVFFSEGRELQIKVQRDSELKIFAVKPSADSGDGRFTLGVMPYTTGITLSRVVKGSAAELSGLSGSDTILKINGEIAHTPSELSEKMQKGEGKDIPIVYRNKNGEEKTAQIKPEMTEVFIVSSTVKKRGMENFVGNEEFKQLIAQSRVRVDGKPISGYNEFLNDVNRAASGKSDVIIDVDKTRYNGKIEVKKRYMIGIEQKGVVFEMVDVKYGPGEGLIQSFIEPWDFLVMNIKGFGMLFSGKMDVRESLSGPIRIGKLAGDVLIDRGISDFILLMAKISIILMFMNLLPIPAVDGSHLVFYIIEAIRGKPLNENIMTRIQTFGVVFLIVLGVFVIINDITMLPFVQDLFK
jgi:regulator of sigma E protease